MKVVKVLCPEHVPFENKGEEAIIQGTIDALFYDVKCEYHVVDWNSKELSIKNGVYLHPGSLFFSDWRSREFE